METPLIQHLLLTVLSLPLQADPTHSNDAELSLRSGEALQSSAHAAAFPLGQSGVEASGKAQQTTGSGKVDSKTISANRGPLLGSLKVDLHGNGRATVSWNTVVPCTAKLEYGPSRTNTQTIEVGGLRSAHSIRLSGLTANTNYIYSVRATDARGNVRIAAKQRFNSGGQVSPTSGVEVSGKLQMWYPVTLSFTGPLADELSSSPNPFLDYRLAVTATSPGGASITVPGYFDGDGNGKGVGNIWRVRFPTHEDGRWTFEASFVQGPLVAIDETLSSGTPTAFDGLSGYFDILPADPNAPGFYKWGKLLYTGEHYLKFLGGPHFIKAGSNSPENFLGYAGFDNTKDMGGRSVTGLVDGLHEYGPHIRDWGYDGLGDFRDPLFKSQDSGIDSRGIIGALNFLNSRNINSLFMLPMNLGGDGFETCPYVAYDNTPYAKTHFDISKLNQWGEVLEHAGRKGIMLQFVLAETEIPNELWLDNGTLGTERKLYYRELIARFGHLLAIKWNLCEENDYDITVLEGFANYIQSLDPYKHTIGFHTFPLPVTVDEPQWDAVLGDPRFSTNSIQAFPYLSGLAVEKWRVDSAAMGHKWIVEFDEQTVGLTDDNATLLRKKTLYDVLFSGGHVEWYAGYYPLPLGGDLRIENFGRRDEMWGYAWNARKFLERYTAFWLMSPMDSLVSGETSVEGGAEVFAIPGVQYAIYLPSALSTGQLDLTGATGSFNARWYNPRTGLREGRRYRLQGGAKVSLPAAPSDPDEDWVLHVGR